MVISGRGMSKSSDLEEFFSTFVIWGSYLRGEISSLRTSRILVISGHIVALFIFMVISGRIVSNVVNPGCRVSMW